MKFVRDKALRLFSGIPSLSFFSGRPWSSVVPSHIPLYGSRFQKATLPKWTLLRYRLDILLGPSKTLIAWTALARGSANTVMHLYDKIPTKLWTSEPWWNSWLVICIYVPGEWCIPRTGKLYIWDPPRSLPMCVHNRLIQIYISYNETSVISIASSWVLWIVLINYQTWADSGNPQIYSQFY